MLSLRSLLTALMTLSISTVIFASEADEYREKAMAMEREAKELAEHGKIEEAKRLDREASELFQRAEHLERDRPDPRRIELQEIRNRLHDLENEHQKLSTREGAEPRLNEIRRESEHLERVMHELFTDIEREHQGDRRSNEMREGREHEEHHGDEYHRDDHHGDEHRDHRGDDHRDHHGDEHRGDDREHHGDEHREHHGDDDREHHGDEHDSPQGEIMHRLQNMRIAVDHLHQAGLHDIAEHVAQRARAAEQELHQREQESHHENHDDPVHQVMRQLEMLRHEIGRLREDVNQLKNR